MAVGALCPLSIKRSPFGDEQGRNLSSGLCCPVTPAHAFLPTERSLLPSFAVCGRHHKLSVYEEATTAGSETSLSSDGQMGHVRAGVWFRLNTANNLLWNKEPRVPSHRLVGYPNTVLAEEDGAKVE